jgi:hypothetical protein
VFQHVSILRRVVEYEAALLEHAPGTYVVVATWACNGLWGRCRGTREGPRSRSCFPVIATDPEPHVALAFDLPAPHRADDSPAGDDRSRDHRWVGLDLRLVLEERGRSREGNAAIALASGSAWNSNSVSRSRSILSLGATLSITRVLLGTTAPGTPHPSVRWVQVLGLVEDALAERLERLHPRHRIAPTSGAHRQTRERLLRMHATTSQACSPFEATAPRLCAHVTPVLFQDEDCSRTPSARPSRPKTDVRVVVASACEEDRTLRAVLVGMLRERQQ